MNCGEVKYSRLWSHYHEVAISIEHNCRQRSLKFFVANGFLSAFNRYTIYIPRLSFVKLNWLHMYGNTLFKKFDRQHKTNKWLLHSLVLHVTFTSWVHSADDQRSGFPLIWIVHWTLFRKNSQKSLLVLWVVMLPDLGPFNWTVTSHYSPKPQNRNNGGHSITAMRQLLAKASNDFECELLFKESTTVPKHLVA